MRKKKQRKTKKRPHITNHEDLLVKLQDLIKTGHQNADVANSLTNWYMENKYWTNKQLNYAKALVKKKKVVQKRKKYHLYAINAGNLVKLGYSSDVRRRMNSMQTGCPDKLKVLWRYYVGDMETDAKSQEKKLHRYCKKHHKRGEWYDMACMSLVDQFSKKAKAELFRNEIGLDLELLASSPI